MKLSSQSRAIKLLINVNDYLRNKYIISPKLYDITHNRLNQIYPSLFNFPHCADMSRTYKGWLLQTSIFWNITSQLLKHNEKSLMTLFYVANILVHI